MGRRYGPVTALTDINLDIVEGEFLTLLGPSGSGKTTLLNLIAGTVEVTTGRVWIDGRDVTGTPPMARGLGMVFQNYALFPHMTVGENIAFPLRVRRLPEREIRRKVAEVLDLVRLPEVTGRKPKELSGGQQQRIAIARCLVYDPSLVLMDEPLGALDKKLRQQMQLEIKRLHTLLGMTIVYVTHDQEEALVMSDRICLMHDGRIEQLGTASDLYFRPATVFAADFLGESNLLDGECVAVASESLTVRTAGGVTMSGLTSVGLARGDRCKLVIRPENIALLGPNNVAPCIAEGVLEEMIFVGGVTNFRVRLHDGVILTAKRLTTEARLALTPGASVRLGWRAADVVVLR
ncbi:MAG TPA: ABC transporter ATP-binding protein [Stellaceae bacterium]|nr:ABC transporter ATP-binding protein [Stellaceae bacterium]